MNKELTFFQRIKSKATMKRKYSLFWELGDVDKEHIYLWEDCYGIEWLAISKWGFRLRY